MAEITKEVTVKVCDFEGCSIEAEEMHVCRVCKSDICNNHHNYGEVAFGSGKHESGTYRNGKYFDLCIDCSDGLSAAFSVLSKEEVLNRLFNLSLVKE